MKTNLQSTRRQSAGYPSTRAHNVLEVKVSCIMYCNILQCLLRKKWSANSDLFVASMEKCGYWTISIWQIVLSFTLNLLSVMSIIWVNCFVKHAIATILSVIQTVGVQNPVPLILSKNVHSTACIRRAVRRSGASYTLSIKYGCTLLIYSHTMLQTQLITTFILVHHLLSPMSEFLREQHIVVR